MCHAYKAPETHQNVLRDPSLVFAGATLTWGFAQKYDEACELYKRALAVDPDHVMSLLRYGSLLADEYDDLNVAEQCFQRATEIDPECPEALQSYAELLEQRGELEKATVMYDQALMLVPHDVEIQRACKRMRTDPVILDPNTPQPNVPVPQQFV
mmetsp:Transcript_5057/g.12757  ORF Transcript_5057/g.12757 Transcript_5057/m.12757 type:complete len:155 (+) Transcript_5057:306-770(+)